MNLQAFCGYSSCYDLFEPFVQGKRLWATDGKIAVSIPSEKEDSTGIRPDMAAMFHSFKPEECTEPFPFAPNDYAFCRACHATAREDCPEDYAWEEDYGCALCWGTGWAQEGNPMEFGDKVLAARYLAKIAKLPGVKYRPDGLPKKPLHFVADNGLQGILAALTRPM